MQNTGGGGTDDMAMAPHDAGARDSPPRSVVYDAGDVGCPCAVVVWPNGGSGETNKYEVRSLKTVQTKYFVLRTYEIITFRGACEFSSRNDFFSLRSSAVG